MRKIIRWKWWILALWAVIAASAVITLPDLGELVREKGQPGIREEYSSQIAGDLEKKLNDTSAKGKEMTMMVVFSGEREKLSSADLKNIREAIQDLRDRDRELGITQVLTHFEEKELKDQLVSKDGTTVLAALSVDRGQRSVQEVRDQVEEALGDPGVKHELTGAELINEDFARTTLDGVRKTEQITVIFIILVLLLVFRSPLAPLVSLISVAASYLVSLAVVAHLVDRFDFPFANFTQIFLVLVLFGIGTDYNILLFSRFKEEMARRKSVSLSIVETYRTAGKTVVYSALAVLIGFASLGLAQFSIYQAGVAVAIGVLFLLLSLFTIIPFFMAILGKKMFWPSRKVGEQTENRLWTFLSATSYRRPLVSLLLVLILTVPVLFLYEGNLSYNSLEEMDDKSPSVRGFNMISDHFGPGKTMPVSVMLESDKPLDSQEGLAFIDQMTESLTRVQGVEAVFGPTRPKGEPIEELYIDKQTEQTKEGIGKAGKGTGQIQKGLDETVRQIRKGTDKDFSRVEDLVEGTESARFGVSRIRQAMEQIRGGVDQGAGGAGEIHSGLKQLETGMEQLSVSTDRLSGGMGQLNTGYQRLGSEYKKLEDHVGSIKALALQMGKQVQNLEQTHPELSGDPNFQQLKQMSQNLEESLGRLEAGLHTLNSNMGNTNAGLSEAHAGLKQVAEGQRKMLSGVRKLKAGSSQLTEGLQKGAQGQGQVADSLFAVENGLGEIAQGQKQLNTGLQGLESNLSQLRNGLGKSAEGLDQITEGLQQAEGYLGDLARTEASHTFFVPEKVLKGEEFQKSLDAYMSDDRKVMKWQVILEGDPYSKDAMKTAAELDSTVTGKLEKSEFAHARHGVGGVSSQNRDLNQISTGDLNRTAMLMLAGITLVLLWILRSFWNTVYIIGSLILSYFTALATTEQIFSAWLGIGELTWTVPFFSMIMVIALGVDYSIFLMMRFREYPMLTPGEAFALSAKKIGSVVISAALILALTFAALYPSGVLTLTQIATVVIIGLFLLAFVMLPIFLPAMISVTERLNTVPTQTRKENS